MRDDLIGDGSLFQPDIVLPTQFFGALAKRVPQEAEYLLVIAVLQDAIECFQEYCFATGQERREESEEARNWIESDDRRWPFSFENICDILKIDPDYLREGLRAWEKRARAAHQRANVLEFKRQPEPALDERRSLTAKAS